MSWDGIIVIVKYVKDAIHLGIPFHSGLNLCAGRVFYSGPSFGYGGKRQCNRYSWRDGTHQGDGLLE